jgi:hypothetical protein
MPNIPMDILQEVFKQIWTSPLQAYKAYEFPWYLGHVCSKWRAVFLSMQSTFWNKIEIEWYDNSGVGLKEQDAANVTEIVHFFLDCTHGAPFSFAFCMRGCYAEEDIDYNILPTLVDLINCSEQWEEVSIKLLSTDLVVLCATKGRLSQLKKLEIDVKEDPDYEDASRITPSMVTSVFEDAPILKKVVIWGFSPWKFKFNWSALTVVTLLRQGDRKGVLAVVRETINLVELTIKTRYLDPYIETRESIHLPHLERLSIGDVALLAFLETPSLQRLRIEFGSTTFLGDGGVTAAFLRRCGNSLSTLVTYCSPLGIVKDILLSAPELDHLALFDVTKIADLFKWMAETGTQEVRFNSLRVSWDRHWPLDLGVLQDLIARRNPPNTEENLSPKELFIHMSKMDDSETANLESLCRDRGIKFGFVGDVMGSILPWGVDY